MLNNQEVTIYGTGEQIRDFVHVYDVIQANILSLDRAKTKLLTSQPMRQQV